MALQQRERERVWESSKGLNHNFSYLTGKTSQVLNYSVFLSLMGHITMHTENCHQIMQLLFVLRSNFVYSILLVLRAAALMHPFSLAALVSLISRHSRMISSADKPNVIWSTGLFDRQWAAVGVVLVWSRILSKNRLAWCIKYSFPAWSRCLPDASRYRDNIGMMRTLIVISLWNRNGTERRISIWSLARWTDTWP